MSQDFLSQLIRSYGSSMPGFIANYLEQSLKLFMTQQQNLRGQVKRVVGIDPVVAMADVAQKNFGRWKSLQDEVMRRFSGGSRSGDSSPEAPVAESQKKAG